MLAFIEELIFRRVVIRDIMIRSGQAKPSVGLQFRYGVCSAFPYLVLSALMFVATLAVYVSHDDAAVKGTALNIGSVAVSLVALGYGLLVNPGQGAVSAIERFVSRSKANGVSGDIIVQGLPKTIGSATQQVKALGKVYVIVTLIIFVIGLLVEAIGLVF